MALSLKCVPLSAWLLSLALLGACSSAPRAAWTDAAIHDPGASAGARESVVEAPRGELRATEPDADRGTLEPRGTAAAPILSEETLYGPRLQEPDVQPTAPPAAPPTAPPLHDHENLYRKWGLSVGAAGYASFHTSLQVSSPVLIGAILDLEDLLGVDSKSFVGRVDGFYSFNKRNRIDVAYYDIRRSGSKVVPDDIEVGDTIIPAGRIDTTFDTRIFKLAYRYNFVTDYRTVIGASLGLHVMDIKTSLRATAGSIDEGETFKALAPLPLLGLHGAYALSEKWRLVAGAEALRVSLGPVDGFVLDSVLNIEHDTWEHFGWGIGLNSFTLVADLEGDSGLDASIDYGYSGAMLYLRTYF